MSRTSLKTLPNQRPVSKNAYNSFIDRISRVMPNEGSRQVMIKALDLYLAGDGRYCDWLTDSLRMVFEMLRFDVDKAIERSARARARRRSPRKVNKPAAVKANTEVKSKPITADTSLLFPDATTDTDEIKEEDIRIPRRLRRAAAHASRSKRRWQKIG